MKQSTPTLPYEEDLQKIKLQARESIRDGALTKDYSLDAEVACKHLNSALATEILCVLRYRHHEIAAKGIDRKEVAEEFAEHAREEEKHMMMIANRINQLGGDPDFNPATFPKQAVTDFGDAKTLIEMINDDLVAERIVITVYRDLIEWFGMKDPTTRIMLEKILKDEEEHANDLADLLHSNSRVD